MLDQRSNICKEMAGLTIDSAWRVAATKVSNVVKYPPLPNKKDVVDVVIVGAGFTGSSSAYHLSKAIEEKRSSAKSVLLLDQGRICEGASSR